jgi:PIN domain nuclease of toxin-antitoxin system
VGDDVSPSVVLLDTHVVLWWSAEPDRVSKRATSVLEDADQLAVAAVTWVELAWMARSERVVLSIPVRAWLEGLASQLRTMTISPAIADTAVTLPSAFPRDPADRLIFATAVEHQLPLVTKDRSIRDSRLPGVEVVW